MIACLATGAVGVALGLVVGEFRRRIGPPTVPLAEYAAVVGRLDYEHQRRLIAEDEIRRLRALIPMPFGVGAGSLWEPAGIPGLPAPNTCATFADDLVVARRAAATQELADEDAMTGGAGFP